MGDLISRKALLAAYDERHKGPPGGARELIEDAPSVPAVPLDKLCEWLSDHAGRPMDCVGKLCGKCEFDGVGVGQEKCWENLIRKWMEASE